MDAVPALIHTGGFRAPCVTQKGRILNHAFPPTFARSPGHVPSIRLIYSRWLPMTPSSENTVGECSSADGKAGVQGIWAYLLAAEADRYVRIGGIDIELVGVETLTEPGAAVGVVGMGRMAMAARSSA